MNKLLLFALTLMLSASLQAQDLTCKDFKTGILKGYITAPFQASWTLERFDDYQVEWVTKEQLPKEMQGKDRREFDYVRIHWLDDCNFLLMPDERRQTLTPGDSIIQEAGGIAVEMLAIEGNCYIYKSTLVLEDGAMVMEGKLCKEE